MASSRERLPLPCDDIVVSFQLGDDGIKWWPAVVEDIQVLPAGSGVLATATVIYEKAKSYPAERVTVCFMRNNIVRPDHPSTGSDSQSCSWKFQDDDGDAPDSDEMISDDEPEPKRRATGSSSSAAATNDIEQIATIARPDVVQEINERVECNTKTMDRIWREVSGRLHVLEQGLSDMSNCDHRAFIHERVKAVRVMLKVKAIEQIQRPLRRPPTNTRTSTSNGLVTRSNASVSHACDWDLFKNVAQSVFESAAARNVIFLPSYVSTQHAAHDIDSFCIVFRSAWSLFEWLGILNECEKRSLLVTVTSSKQGLSMRLLGGMQMTISQGERPLNIFVGASCIRKIQQTTTCQDFRTVIQTSPGGHCMGTNTIPDNLEVGRTQAGMEAVGMEQLDDFDCFSLTWSADSKTSQKTARLLLSVGEGVRVGTLQLHVPCCGFFTNALCAKLNDLLGSLDQSSFA